MPPGAVAVVEGVDDGVIDEDELERAVAANAQLSGDAPPAPGTPEYGLVAGDALDQLILERWVAGEAEARGTSPEALAEEPVRRLRATWGPRTKCLAEVASRLCGGSEEVAPPDIPPASG